MNIPKPFTKKEQSKSQKPKSVTSMSHSLRKESSCVDMEELMQFEAARQRALTQAPPKITERSLTDFAPHRIFINQIDTFNGSHIVEHLCNLTINHEEEGDHQNGSESQKITEGLDEEDEEFLELDEHSVNTIDDEKSISSAYEILGTLEFYNNPKYSRAEGITELLDNENKCEFLEKLFTCGFIIYDITSDLYCHPKQVEEAKWVLESIVKCLEMMEKKLPKAFSKFKDCRVFILISTLLTWVKTKPIDPDTPNLPFTERDYRKRKPHPNYKIHCEFEKRVIELGKRYPNHLKTIVIGTGVTYGYEEDVLHFLFKMAWEDAPFLPIFSPGNNHVPLIHIRLLANIIEQIVKNFPQKLRYIVATDPTEFKLKHIVKALAKSLGNGKTKMVDKEEAFLYPDVKQRNYDLLTANINISPDYIMDYLAKLNASLPFVENMPALIAEYKKARGLKPIKIFIHGPPGSGKTFLAKRLSRYYDIPHLYEKKVVEDTLQSLNQKIEELIAKEELEKEKANQEGAKIEGDETVEDEEEEEEEEEEPEGENLETLKQKLQELEENMESNGNKLDEEHLLSLFKEKLLSSACQNKGYIIDGYPETMEQTKTLYAYEEDEEPDENDDLESQGGDISRMCNMKIMPRFVESLDASDEFLMNRMIKLPNINMTEYEESNLCHRLTEFRNANTENNTPLIFYDELDVHPMIYNIENDPHPSMEPTLQAIINHVGPPKNYGSAEIILQEEEQECRKDELENIKTQADEIRKIAEERRENVEKWMFQKNQELEMEEKALFVMSMPLRNYLMKYIFPCLTRGLVEVARLRPEDPVEFLSEFLFRENPEGKMFQPDYDKRAQELAEAKKEYERMMEERLSHSSKFSKKSFSREKSVVSGAISGVANYKCSLVSSDRKTKSSSTKSATSKKKSSVSLGITGVSEVTGVSGVSAASGVSGASGICSCQKSPSLSTCSSDRIPLSPVSCTCPTPESCDTCESEEDEQRKKDPCACPCD